MIDKNWPRKIWP